MIRRLVPLLALALLAGCGPSSATLRATLLQSLIGRPEVDAIQALGVPSRTIDVPQGEVGGGGRFLEWDQMSQIAYPGMWGYGWGPPWYGGVPPSVVTYTCQTMLEVRGGKVVSWAMRGDGC